jgi:hypothetical protein
MVGMWDNYRPKARGRRKIIGAKTQSVVGLARNPKGVPFQCGACMYFGRKKPGICDNPNPEIYDKKVDAVTECCNLYDHKGMKVIV